MFKIGLNYAAEYLNAISAVWTPRVMADIPLLLYYYLRITYYFEYPIITDIPLFSSHIPITNMTVTR